MFLYSKRHINFYAQAAYIRDIGGSRLLQRPLGDAQAAQIRVGVFFYFCCAQIDRSTSMRRLRTYAPSVVPGRCGGLWLLRWFRISASVSWLIWVPLCCPELFWVRLCSPGLVWARQGYLGISWAPLALLGSPALSWARLGSPGLS